MTFHLNKCLNKRLLAFTLSVLIFQIALSAFGVSGFAAYQNKRTVYVHLFEWKWTDIALECENFLGPQGYAAIQVSPPQEHAVLENSPWYERYQPVSYQLNSRSGNRAEFADMVSRCKAAGVDIYVDAVINHMAWVNRTNQPKYGTAGTPYAGYTYSGTYQPWDFHRCGRNGDNSIRDYQDRWEVQNCDLATLADLRTEDEYVRGRIAAYMNDLLDLGVAGFRLDGAKHMPVDDLVAILSRLKRRAYFYSEVIDFGGEPIRSEEYYRLGGVTDFRYARQLAHTFNSGRLGWLEHFGPAWGFVPTDNAIVFIDTHDTQRGHGGGGEVLTYKNGQRYILANTFMLAWPHGYPQVMSSYVFEDGNQGPPLDANGDLLSVYDENGNTRCGKEWVCEHRWPAIARMVDFHNYTDPSFYVTKWWSDGDNRIAFGRGNRGYVVINNTLASFQQYFDTGLPAGTYCDAQTGEVNVDRVSCSGTTITVDANGWARIAVPANGAVAIYGGAKLGTPYGRISRPVEP